MEPCGPRGGDHRYHHVAEQSKTGEACGEAERHRNCTAELDDAAEVCKEVAGFETSTVRHEIRCPVDALTVKPPEQLLGAVHEEYPRQGGSHDDESEVDRTG